jgi:nitrogen regulatory protein PII
MVFPEVKSDPRVRYLDYTWLISGILYEGGTDKLVPELMKRGINEVYFYNVAGTIIGQKTVTGVSGSFDVEQFHVVVTADQAENIFDFIYRFCELSEPNKGIIYMNKLKRSTKHSLQGDENTQLEEITEE